MFTPTHVSFIVMELHYMLALNKGQLHFEIIQVSYVLRLVNRLVAKNEDFSIFLDHQCHLLYY